MHKRYLICFLGSNILLQSGYLAPKIISLYAFTLTKQRLLYGAFNKHWKEPIYRLRNSNPYFMHNAQYD